MILQALKDSETMLIAWTMIIGMTTCFYYWCWRANHAMDVGTNIVNVYINIDDGSHIVDRQRLTSVGHTNTDGNAAVVPSSPLEQQQEIPMVPAQLISNETPHVECIRIDVIAS